MKSNIFKKWGDTIKATLQKRKQGLKKVEIKEDSQGPEISNADVTIAKIKSQKRKINDMIKKVDVDWKVEHVESLRMHYIQGSCKGRAGEGRSCRLNPIPPTLGFCKGPHAGV